MQSFPNIERSVFRRGEYIGYCNGAQRIRRSGIGARAGWETYSLASQAGSFVHVRASTLRELSTMLAECASSSVLIQHGSPEVA